MSQEQETIRKREEFNIEEILKRLKLMSYPHEKIRIPYYPRTIMRTPQRKILTRRGRSRSIRSTQKASDIGGEDGGDPAARHTQPIVFSGCTFNIGNTGKLSTQEEKLLSHRMDNGLELSETKFELTAALQRAEAAEQALADTRAELAEAKAQAAAPQEVGSPTLTRAEKAAQAKSEKSLAAWKEVFPVMMKVYARCMEEGEKPRQRPDFYAMFNELDAELTDTQMRFFRSCLPEGHSDTDGGKPGKV